MRPEGFNTDKIVRQVRADMEGSVSSDMYVEAGADAMLEALIKECRVERPIEWLHSLCGKGYLVFIPGEKG